MGRQEKRRGEISGEERVRSPSAAPQGGYVDSSLPDSGYAGRPLHYRRAGRPGTQDQESGLCHLGVVPRLQGEPGRSTVPRQGPLSESRDEYPGDRPGCPGQNLQRSAGYRARDPGSLGVRSETRGDSTGHAFRPPPTGPGSVDWCSEEGRARRPERSDGPQQLGNRRAGVVAPATGNVGGPVLGRHRAPRLSSGWVPFGRGLDSVSPTGQGRGGAARRCGALPALCVPSGSGHARVRAYRELGRCGRGTPRLRFFGGPRVRSKPARSTASARRDGTVGRPAPSRGTLICPGGETCRGAWPSLDRAPGS